MPYSYNKLRGRIIEKYGSQRAFARELGMSYVAVSNKMTGKVGFSQDDIIEWMNLLDIKTKDVGEYFFA